jgi:hypothetical protein
MLNYSRTLAFMTALASCTACSAGAPEESATSTGQRGAPISWERFAESVYREAGEHGLYFVDGDIPIRNEAELRAYYDAWSDPEGALTVDQTFDSDNTWSFPASVTLSYCVTDDLGAKKASVEAAMAAATASWQDVIGVRFEYKSDQSASCDENNSNVTFNVREVPDDGIFAGSFFPDYERAERQLKIRPSAYTTTAGGRDFEGILRHELGHALGFRHEHIWLDPTCTGESSDNARLVTSYDVNSIMHYPQCRPSESGGYRQTDTDYRGAAELYGMSALLIDAAIRPLL